MTIAFLIEGNKSKGIFPEVDETVSLAEANSAIIFDAIDSCSKNQIQLVLAQLPPEQHPLIAVMLFVDFSSEAPLDRILETIVKTRFQDEENNLPLWLDELSSGHCNEFIQEQISIHFDGLTAEYKEWAKTTHQLMNNLSNQLSAEHFAKFIAEHPEVDKVYALVGSLHKNFIDTHQSVENMTEHGCCLDFDVLIDERWVSVSLHHGTHGDMSHFSSLQASCREQGLTIPRIKSKEELDINKLIGLLLGNTNPTATSASHSIFSPPVQPHNTPSHHRKRFDVKQAAEQYDYWKKAYNHPEGISERQSLVNWLVADHGGRVINSYDEFCQLANKLSEMRYKLSIPPSEEEFDEGMNDYNYKESQKGNTPSHHRKRFNVKQAAEQYDYWKKAYNHPEGISEQQSLVSWLVADDGGRVINRYDELCQLAKKLSEMGYELSIPPSEEEFDEGMNDYNYKKSQRHYPGSW